jgi:hypothetical protein
MVQVHDGTNWGECHPCIASQSRHISYSSVQTIIPSIHPTASHGAVLKGKSEQRSLGREGMMTRHQPGIGRSEQETGSMEESHVDCLSTARRRRATLTLRLGPSADLALIFYRWLCRLGQAPFTGGPSLESGRSFSVLATFIHITLHSSYDNYMLHVTLPGECTSTTADRVLGEAYLKMKPHSTQYPILVLVDQYPPQSEAERYVP